jgi:hypothetical protein
MTFAQYDSPYNVRDTGNAVRAVFCHEFQTAYAKGYLLDVMASIGVATFGIIAGTGVNAPTINDYALQSPIVQGTGAGQLQYAAVTFGTPASDATTSQVTVTRNLTNGSGNSITINEIGLICRAYYTDEAGYFLIIRDVISGGIAIPNGQTITINYRPQVVI